MFLRVLLSPLFSLSKLASLALLSPALGPGSRGSFKAGPAPALPLRGQPAEQRASAGIRPPLRPYSAMGTMAGSALKVAGRRLSQHTGSGAPVLLRQVRYGWTREQDYWVLSGCKGGTPGSFKSGEIPWPQS